MSFTRAFRRKLRAVRVRCGVNLLLRQTGRILAVGGGAVGLAVLVERLFAVPVLAPWALWIFWGAAVGLVLLLWLLSLPSRMQASLLLDDRLRFHERFSTTLAFAESEDPFARAARAESLQAVERADLRGHFPIRLSPSWYYGAGLWLAAIALLLYMPQKDLLGLLRQKERRQEQAAALEDARTAIGEATKPIQALVHELKDPALEEDLKKLDDLARAGDPEEAKRQTIKALGDLSEKIKQMQAGAPLEAGDMLQEMLKQLHGSTDPFVQQIRLSLAKGNYNQAADALRQLQKQLSDGTLPAERRQELAAKLQELAKELQKLAAEKRQIEEELEKRGLDKKLAQASPEELREALRKQGLSPELIDQLMEEMKATQGAGGRCAGLGNALAGVGEGGEGLSAEDLFGVIEQLDALESLRLQAGMLRASLGEISDCICDLGAGMCDSGLIGAGQWRRGSGGGQGEGIGRAPGTHEASTEPLLAADKTTRAPTRSDSRNDPVVASWYFKDTLIKGEAQRTFSEVVQAGRASAAEAISDNQIPRRYEGAVKAYFDQLEQVPRQ
jgi:predicted GNAT family acetyltransferase